MRRLLLSILVVLTFAFAAVGCTSCKDGDESSSGAQTGVLELTADVYELTVGESFTLGVENQPSGEITFSSSNAAVATVTESGVVDGLSEGVAVITVTVGSESESCRVTVKKSPTSGVLTFLGEEATLRVGGTEKTLSVFHEGVKVETGVTYSVQDASIATVDEQGRAKGLQKGETTVTATYNGFSATCKLIVKNIVSMQVTKNVVFLKPNESFEITADVLTGAALTKLESPAVEWSVGDDSVATIATNKNVATVTGVAGGATVLTVGYDEAIEEIYVSVAKSVGDYESFKALADTKYPYIVLSADIDVSSATWAGQGTATDGKPVHVIEKYSGILDGDGHKLYGLTKTTTDYVHNVGFFGRVTATATIKNVLFEGTLGYNADGTTVDAITARTGIFVWENAGTIQNCYIKGEIYTQWKYNTSGVYTLIGAVYRNNGTLENLVTDISVQTAQHTAQQNARKFGFAAVNHGTIKNCVTVSSAVRGSSYDWLSGDINDAVAGGSLGTSVYWENGTGYSSYQSTLEACVQKDAGRTDSYVFTSYAGLLSGTGYGDKFTDGEFDNSSYAEVSSATAQAKLGAAWSFDADKGTIAFMSREIFRDVSIKHANGVLTWKESGEATVWLDGAEIAKTSAQTFDLFGYFKANAATLTTGDKTVRIQTAELQRESTFSFSKPTTLDELKTAAGKDGYIALTQDIDVSGATWTGDGTSAPVSVIPELKAVVEGNGHKLYGLTKTTTDYVHNVGFIGRIKSGAKIENVVFEGSLGYAADGTKKSAITARTGIFAWENAGTIKNCYIKGEIYTPWKYATSSMYSLIGAVYRNKGTIESVLTEISVQTSEWTAAANPRKFGFAVFNTGTIKNSVTVSTATKTVQNGTQYGWMSNDSDEAFALNGASGEFGTSVWNGSTGNFGQGSLNTSDAGRTDCYLFRTYADLLNGSGYGDEVTDGEFDSSSYADVSSATAQATLGSAWSFDAASGTVKLGTTVVYTAE